MRALILAGGSGTRFWPLSRRRRPKQLLSLDGDRSLLQRTVERLEGVIRSSDVWVCTTVELAAAIRRQLPEVPAEQVLAEPEGRDTAAAISWALRMMPEEARQEVVAVLPADHRIEDDSSFRTALEWAADAASESELVVALGVVPRWPATGYGYLELEAGATATDGEPRRVVGFTEKPERATAVEFVDSGHHLWNAGIFVFRGEVLLDAVRTHLPVLWRGLERLTAEPERTDELYGQLPSVSIDRGVMEELDELLAVPLDCGWSDLGGWRALREVLEADDRGVVVEGDVVVRDCRDSLLVAEAGTVAAIGVSELLVVRTDDAVLVAPLDRSEEVKELVRRLEREGRDELL